MHEASVVDGLMQILFQQSAQNGIERVVAVKIVIGKLRGLDVRQIRGCFEVFSEGTIAEGARLDIVELEVTARCRDCGADYTVPRFAFECPVCHGRNADVTGGRELHIESFDGRRRPDE